MKRLLAASLAVLTLAATLTACSDTPDSCDPAPVAAFATKRPSGSSKGRSTSKPKPAGTKSSKPVPKHHSHDDIDICEDDD
ncbi:hypothetical protein ABZ419_11195 [Streptomyces cinnamoneus]|uniref:hypothetical protein n=1 Tax=Streptomyces cinnamoneus TaxID=53446 RepID=UPI0033BFDBBB